MKAAVPQMEASGPEALSGSGSIISARLVVNQADDDVPHDRLQCLICNHWTTSWLQADFVRSRNRVSPMIGIIERVAYIGKRFLRGVGRQPPRGTFLLALKLYQMTVQARDLLSVRDTQPSGVCWKALYGPLNRLEPTVTSWGVQGHISIPAPIIASTWGSIGGAAAAWPVVAWTQQKERVRRIGILMPFPKIDARFEGYTRGFRQAR